MNKSVHTYILNTLYFNRFSTAPDIAPRNFHVSLVNSTAVEVIWSQPSRNTIGLNGALKGFKIVVEKLNGITKIINISSNTTIPIVAYIVNNLEPGQQYRFSMLMYTIADGPEGMHLTVKMPKEGRQSVQVISYEEIAIYFQHKLYAVTSSILGIIITRYIFLWFLIIHLPFLCSFFMNILQTIFQSSFSLVSMVMVLNVFGGIPTTEVSMSFAAWDQQMSPFTGNMLTAVELELAIEAFEKDTFRMVQEWYYDIF